MREIRELIRESVKIIRRDTLDVGGNVRHDWLVPVFVPEIMSLQAEGSGICSDT
jgi:ribosomal protein S4E